MSSSRRGGTVALRSGHRPYVAVADDRVKLHNPWGETKDYKWDDIESEIDHWDHLIEYATYGDVYGN